MQIKIKLVTDNYDVLNEISANYGFTLSVKDRIVTTNNIHSDDAIAMYEYIALLLAYDFNISITN